MTKTCTLKELASLAGYSYRRLHDIDKTLESNKKLFVKSEDGKYDLALFVQRWVDYNCEKEDECDSLEDVKAKHELVKKRKTEIEVAQMEGRLVDIGDIKKLWGGIAHNVMQNMIRLPSKIAPRLIMLENVESIEAIIDTEIRDVLKQISDTPIPSEYEDSFEEAETEADA